MKRIELTRAQYAMIDDEDYDRVKQFNWQAAPNKKGWRAIRTECIPRRRTVSMHRYILGDACNGKQVDHKDFNGLNNTRSNLRICDQSQNKANTKFYRRRVNRLPKGVHPFPTDGSKSGNRFRATIGYKGRQISLGSFRTIEEAVDAYNDAAIKLFGEFACLSDPKISETRG